MTTMLTNNNVNYPENKNIEMKEGNEILKRQAQ